MIRDFIDHLVIGYPTEISAVQNAVDLLMPYALFGSLLWVVWQLLRVFDRWLDRSEARRAAKTREPHYRTADGKKIQRETEQIWAPWHDTVPPAQKDPSRPANRVRAGPPTVIQFPSADAERRRQS